MIEISNVDVYGWEHAIRGMRNPKNSWDKSDSFVFPNNRINLKELDDTTVIEYPTLGVNDHDLAQTLADAGTDHGKFLRMIVCYADVNAPLYWYNEADTYRMGVEKNSCSTMHKIHAKEFTLDDFSHEHNLYYGNLEHTIDALNHAREQYLLTKDKKYWYSMIQLLPSSYNQLRTYMFSYAALRNMYHARKNHKLQEWRDFCAWIKTLPYSELITGEEST
jgi:hypothetical protein